MAEDQRLEHLRRSVVTLLALEREAEQVLQRYGQAAKHHPQADAAFNRAKQLTVGHQDALLAYLGREPGEAAISEAGVASPFSPWSEGEQVRASVPELLRAGHGGLCSMALTYAMLFEKALRLYEPPLRKLAPSHQKDCLQAAQELGALIPGAVARELEQEGLGCHCICPMCGLGACGCVALATQSLHQAWRDVSQGDGLPGLSLPQPRSGSPLAEAGITEGDRLYEIAGEPVNAIPEIQAAIRKHGLGTEVKILVGRNPEETREVTARHVSDYPAG